MVELCIGMVWSFGLCFFLTPPARRLASRLGLVDRPDGRRKLHGRSIPVAGGPVILVSLLVSLLVASLSPGSVGNEAATTSARLFGLVLAAIIICGLGVLDDLGRLRGRHKLLGQFVAISAVIATGVSIDSISLLGIPLKLDNWAIPFTVFFLLGTINSLNLLDGMDGLLTSIAFLLCVVLGSLAVLSSKVLVAYVAFSMAAALLAFLCYNFPPATIFLGDSGSMLIGLVVGVLAIDSSLVQVFDNSMMPPRRMVLSLAAPLALFTLPILDTVAAILRRKLTGRSIYNTDRSHLHHCLLRRLEDPRLVLSVTSVCCLTLGAGVLAGKMLDREWVIILTSLVVIAALIGTRLFGYAEFQLVVQRVGALVVSLLRMPHPDKPRQLEMRLHGNVDWRELWQRILDWEEALELCCLRLDVNAPALGEGYHARWNRGPQATEEEEVLWRAQIPVTLRGRSIGKLEISGRRNGESLGERIALLAKVVQDFEENVSLLADGAATPQTSTLLTSVTVISAEDSDGAQFQRVRM